MIYLAIIHLLIQVPCNGFPLDCIEMVLYGFASCNWMVRRVAIDHARGALNIIMK